MRVCTCAPVRVRGRDRRGQGGGSDLGWARSHICTSVASFSGNRRCGCPLPGVRFSLPTRPPGAPPPWPPSGRASPPQPWSRAEGSPLPAPKGRGAPGGQGPADGRSEGPRRPAPSLPEEPEPPSRPHPPLTARPRPSRLSGGPERRLPPPASASRPRRRPATLRAGAWPPDSCGRRRARRPLPAHSGAEAASPRSQAPRVGAPGSGRRGCRVLSGLPRRCPALPCTSLLRVSRPLTPPAEGRGRRPGGVCACDSVAAAKARMLRSRHPAARSSPGHHGGPLGGGKLRWNGRKRPGRGPSGRPAV